MCVCERERESVCVCVLRERERAGTQGREREQGRERDNLRACVHVSAYTFVRRCVGLCVCAQVCEQASVRFRFFFMTSSCGA